MSEATAPEALERAYRLPVNGTIFFLHDEALSAFEADRGQTLQAHLGYAHAEGRLEAAKRKLRRQYDCFSRDGKFYVLGPREDGFVPIAKRKDIRDLVIDTDGENRILRGSGSSMNLDDLDVLQSNMFEAPPHSGSKETQIKHY